MKKKWYIWFSLLTFGVLWNLIGYEIVKMSRQSLAGHGDKLSLWLKAFVYIDKLIILFLLLPILIFIIISEITVNINEFWLNCINAVELLIFYLLGVYMSYKLALWRTNNLPNKINPNSQ